MVMQSEKLCGDGDPRLRRTPYLFYLLLDIATLKSLISLSLNVGNISEVQ